MKISLFTQWLAVIFISFMLSSCINQQKDQAARETVNETQILLSYLEDNGEIINSALIPSFVEAEEVLGNLRASNYHVIDVRPAEDFLEGHIENSINIKPINILDYFEKKIEPNSFEKIILVCGNSHLSGYVNSVLLTLGYSNVNTLRFGLSSWDKGIADTIWLAARSSKLEGMLEVAPSQRADAGSLPVINTGYSDGYSILRARAGIVLDVTMESMHRSIEQVMENAENYYLINYWPENLYMKGHLPGAVQYDPKEAFHSSRELNTLPTDQPIVIYCFTGQHSAFVTPILRMLGYQAYNMPYGANSFIFNTMMTTQRPTRAFTEDFVRGFPLVRGSVQETLSPEATEAKQDFQQAQGGC